MLNRQAIMCRVNGFTLGNGITSFLILQNQKVKPLVNASFYSLYGVRKIKDALAHTPSPEVCPYSYINNIIRKPI